jgi:hypothetical protein
MSQMLTAPLEFCHRMGKRPSPLLSPDLKMCQLGPGLPMLPPPICVLPFISQMAALRFTY